MKTRALLLATLLAASGTAWAGTVEVRYKADGYTDAGDSAWDIKYNLSVLGLHIEKLAGRMLPADHALTVEVLDLDIAGTVRMFHGKEVRMVRGGADFPRLHLRYTLRVPGQPVRTGEDHVSDMNYTSGVGRFRADTPLWYEKLLLEKWFVVRFASPA
ncbi:MAG: DUF3016 domain-containing protein [Burkholderiales bacterium]|nr:DUF3016 domain-containing protein [Burkholderiales bacterium]